MNNLKYAIIGSGAVGGYYGAALTTAGAEVHFLFKSDYEHIKQNGFKVDSYRQNMFISAEGINAYKSTKDMPKCDIILVALKTNNNILLKELLAPILKENSLIILIQNGLGVEADVAKYFKNQPIVGGITYICSSKIGHGHINHIDRGDMFFAPYNNLADETLQLVISDFKEANLPTDYSNSLLELRWRKLVWNIPYNGMSVVLKADTDTIMTNEASKTIIHNLMQEVVDAANANEGVNIEREYIDQLINLTAKAPAYLPSMRLDYDAKRPLEIEYMYSRPIQEAAKLGVSMPKTEMLRNQLEFIQAGYL